MLIKRAYEIISSGEDRAQLFESMNSDSVQSSLEVMLYSAVAENNDQNINSEIQFSRLLLGHAF